MAVHDIVAALLARHSLLRSVSAAGESGTRLTCCQPITLIDYAKRSPATNRAALRRFGLKVISYTPIHLQFPLRARRSIAMPRPLVSVSADTSTTLLHQKHMLTAADKQTYATSAARGGGGDANPALPARGNRHGIDSTSCLVLWPQYSSYLTFDTHKRCLAETSSCSS
jgi:hypothetical protein